MKEEFEEGLQSNFQEYGSYPDEIRLGLIDMAFNLGNAGLVDKFPIFTKAARVKDWATCANECRREGIGDHRNEMTKKLFEESV